MLHFRTWYQTQQRKASEGFH